MMRHEVVAAYTDKVMGATFPVYVCRCLEEGGRRWLESHLRKHNAWKGGMFAQYPADTEQR